MPSRWLIITQVTPRWQKITMVLSVLSADPVTGRVGVPWDFMPEYWTNIPQMYDREGWKETEIYRSNPELLPAYTQVCEGIDDILASYVHNQDLRV